jgi:hypothetical protein
VILTIRNPFKHYPLPAEVPKQMLGQNSYLGQPGKPPFFASVGMPFSSATQEIAAPALAEVASTPAKAEEKIMGFKSFFTGIVNAEHTMVSWAEKELGILHNDMPAIESVIAAGLKYAGPALQTVVSLEAGSAAGNEVGKILGDAQAGLTAASAFVYDFGATPTASSILGSVSKDLGVLLAAGKVSNPKSVATVTSIVTNLDLLVQAIANKPVIVPVP